MLGRYKMNLALRHMSLLLLILYLLVPVLGFAHVDGPDVRAGDSRSIGAIAGSPCDGCPCSDGQGPRCCDAGFCCCAFHFPPLQGVQLRYDPVVITAPHAESFWMLPQVYLSIFVPPQNQIPDFFMISLNMISH